MGTTTALATGTTALIDGRTGFLLVFDQQQPPGPPSKIPDFATCVSLAEMHRQAAYLAAQIAFSGNYPALQRAILVADHQYFLDVLSCALQFNQSAPSAVDGLQDTTNRLRQPPS